jgi:hypothetical protein
MIVLSLATSAAYFGCKHGHVRWKLPFKCSIETSNFVGCADKVVQIPRIVELWREAKELEDRRLLCGRDGNINEMTMLSTLSPRPGFFAGGAKFDAAVDFTISGSSNATESVPCILQVRDDAFMPELCH